MSETLFENYFSDIPETLQNCVSRRIEALRKRERLQISISQIFMGIIPDKIREEIKNANSILPKLHTLIISEAGPWQVETKIM